MHGRGALHHRRTTDRWNITSSLVPNDSRHTPPIHRSLGPSVRPSQTPHAGRALAHASRQNGLTGPSAHTSLASQFDRMMLLSQRCRHIGARPSGAQDWGVPIMPGPSSSTGTILLTRLRAGLHSPPGTHALPQQKRIAAWQHNLTFTPGHHPVDLFSIWLELTQPHLRPALADFADAYAQRSRPARL